MNKFLTFIAVPLGLFCLVSSVCEAQLKANMESFRRIITAEDSEGKSYVLSKDEPKLTKEIPGVRKIYRLWQTEKMPVSIPIIKDLEEMQFRPPGPQGTLFGLWVIQPASQMTEEDREKYITWLSEQKGLKRGDNSTHPEMHATETIDYLVMLSGELYLVLEKEEILLRPGDFVIQGGVNHRWINRSDKPAVSVIILLGGKR